VKFIVCVISLFFFFFRFRRDRIRKLAAVGSLLLTNWKTFFLLVLSRKRTRKEKEPLLLLLSIARKRGASLANEGEFVRPFFVSTRERSSAARALCGIIYRAAFSI
jgi:hypothetical protein